MPIMLPGATQGKIEGEFVFLTKRVRIPRSSIRDIQPAWDGEGSTVITERGAFRACEDYAALMLHLYGADVQKNPADGGAR